MSASALPEPTPGPRSTAPPPDSLPSRALRILFVTGRFPYPCLKGDQVRAYQQIRRLGQRHRVTLVYLTRGQTGNHAALAGSCERIVAVPFGRWAMARGLASGLFSDLPLQASLYRTAAMRRVLRKLGADGYDLVHLQLARMAPYLEEGACPRPWVVDLVDALSLGMQRRSREDRGVARIVARFEARRLLSYERQICASADRTLVVSARDKEAIGDAPGLTLVPNAVDLEAFPYGREGREPATIVFSGNMGYFPNVSAAVSFAREVLPRVRKDVPEARFEIVGARPARAVQKLAREPGVSVAGYVDDLGHFLRRATVAVAPMRAGSGQQFKILEAMASGTPVVASRVEAEQLGAREGDEVLVGDTSEEIAGAVVTLLRDPGRADDLARKARRFVETSHTWDHSMERLEEAYAAAIAARRPPRPAVLRGSVP